MSDGLGVEGRLVAKGELKWSGRFVIEVRLEEFLENYVLVP